ncbi:MAG: HTTM domain-containing protein [Polyangiales bacterium]
MKRAFARWVAFWDARETGESLSLVRILVPLVIAYDLIETALRGLVMPLWGALEHGGMGPARLDEPICAFYAWFGASPTSTWTLFALTVLSAVTMALGLFSRLSAWTLLVTYAQLAALSPDADRGIDTLLRNVLLVLALAPIGATWSLDALRAEGRLTRDRRVPAWPRYLIVAQLVVLYFFAGMLKQSANWSYAGGYGALFLVLHKPHFIGVEVPHAWLVAAYPLTQAATFATVTWERAAILLPGLLALRGMARPGRLGALVNRLRVLEVWVGMGIAFHLALAVLLALGPFPWGCLALYPALAAPRTLRRWATALGSVRTRRASVPPLLEVASRTETSDA